MSNYWKKKLEELEKEKNKTTTSSATPSSNYWQNKMTELEKEEEKKKQNTDIAPVVSTPKKEEKEDDGSFWDWLGNSAMRGLAQSNKLLTGGIDFLFGKPLQAAGWENNPISKMADYYSDTYDYYAKESNEEAQKLGGDENIGGMGNGYQIAGAIIEGTVAAVPDAIMAVMSGGASVVGSAGTALGKGATSLATQAAYRSGNILTKAGLAVEQMAKNPQFWSSYIKTLEPEYERAIEEGADETAAAFAATISSLLNAGIEIGVDGMSGFQGLPKNVADGGESAILAWVKSALEEGGEEVLQTVVNNAVAKVAYGSDKPIASLDEMAQDFGMGATVGVLVGGGQVGVMGATNAVNNAVQKAESHKLTENEQKVVDLEVEKRIAEEEKDGKKLTNSQKAKIYDQVIEHMDKGYIPIATIEEALGGDTYTSYKGINDNVNALQNEYDTLKKGYDNLDQMKWEQGDLKGQLKQRVDALEQQLNEAKNNPERARIGKQLATEVFNVAKDSRLAESYREFERSRQPFQADVSKYKGKAREVIQRVIDSGIVDNTRQMHEYWDWLANIAEDRDIKITPTTTAEILEMELKLHGADYVNEVWKGKRPNAYRMPDGTIGINMESREGRRFLVGHEITHSLEKAKHYGELRELLYAFAETKMGKEAFEARKQAVAKKYNGITEDADSELTADLVGEYLYAADEDFVRHLSTQNRNLFQKVWDEIKHLYKMATAGSQEARDLERIEHLFAKVYREGGKSNGKKQFSISTDSDGKQLTAEQQEYFKDSKMRDENGNLKVMYHGSQDAGFHIFDQNFSDDDTSFFFVDSNAVAESYSGTNEVYMAKTLKTADDVNELFYEIEAESVYEVKEENGKFVLYDMGDAVAESDTARGIYDEWRDYTGLGYGRSNYSVYLNLKNPLVVYAEGRNWNNVTREFSQEVYDRYQSLTAEEKAALTDLAGWEDVSIFRDGFNKALVDFESGFYSDENAKILARAFNKLGGYDANVYDIFTIASENFSQEALKQFAVKQMNTRDYAQKAKAEGYDGVIFKNIHDNGGYSNGSEGASTVAIAFESNQIKSVANAKPTANADIRYSVSDIDGNPIATERISSNELDNKYSISYNTEIAKGQSDYITAHKAYVTAVELEEAQKVTAAMVDVMMKCSSILPEDKIGKVLTKNGSYDRSVENTTICVRTLAYNEFVDKVQAEIGRPLTQMESFLVSQKMYDIATDPQCLYCYVSLDRKAFNDMLLRYMQDRDTVIAKYNNSDKTDATIEQLYEEFLHGRKPTTEMRKRFDSWLSCVDNGTQLLSLADIATEERQSTIKANGGTLAEQLADARKYAQSASWSKIQKDYVAYRDEILKLGDRVVKNLNEHYGMRWYSFSDYSAAFIVENMQQITDASIRGLKGLSYTKDTDYAEIFAPSGMNINISVFVNTDADGNFFIDEKQSANFEKALALREQYHNVGIVATVTNDDALRWVAEQEWSDVIIPFHIVRTGTDVAEYYKWLNYTAESADTVGDKDMWNAYLDSLNISDNARKRVSKNIYPSEHKNDKATYLNLCESRGLTPRFARFAGEDWYMKLVNETRLSADESSPLKPSYNLEAAKESFAKFVEKGGYEGGWYKDGTDVDAEAKAVAADVLAGKKANEVDYGRQDGFVPEDLIAGRKANRKHGQYSLSLEGEAPIPYGRNDGAMSDGRYIAPTQEVAPVAETAQEPVGQTAEATLLDDHPSLADDEVVETESVSQREAELQAIADDKDGYVSKQAMRLYDEITNLKKGVRASKDLGYLLDHGYEWRIVKNALINIKNHPNRLIDTNSPIESIARELLNERYEDAVYELSDLQAQKNAPTPIKSVKQRLLAKAENLQTELDNDKRLREESSADYSQEIMRLKAEYNARKNKNTKSANDLLRRIERTQRLKDNVDADYAKRISDLEARVAKANEELRTGQSTAEQGAMRRELHQRKIDEIKTAFGRRGLDFDKVLKGAKDLSTFATVDNTPQRVMEKSLGYKEGQILSDLTVNQVAQNETEGIKWLNSFTDKQNGLLAKISKQYNIKPGSKESAAAQMYAEGFYVDENNDIVKYGDADLATDFPNAKVRSNIKGLANDSRIRQIYDDTLAMINESRTRNAYPEIPRLDNYFLHFRAMEDTFSRLGLPFNPNDIRAKDLPTDLNGVTADLKPGQPYFASAMHRTGKRTSFDLLGGLEKYLTSAKNQIYHIDDIQTLRALRNYIADTYGQANGLEGIDALTEEEAQERIEQVYNSHLSTFAKFLNEEANVIAGKTALIDRGLEGIIGRRGITFLNTLNQRVGSNMVGMNISSSLTNFLPVVQTMAKSNKADFIKGFSQTVASKIGSMFGRTNDFAENSPVMIRRKGADQFNRTPYQKIADTGYILMGAVDSISTEIIARTKYNELTRKGMDSQKAHFETDKWVSRMMGDRSLGQQPQIYNSKMLGLFTKFQLEVRNQLDAQFYDTVQEAKVSNEDIQNGLARNAKTAAKVASTFLQLAIAQHAFGKVFESIAGYNPAFDIISVLMTALGFDDDEESEDTALDNIGQGFLELLEDLPYTSTLTGGRIPISSALPIKEVLTGKDQYGNEKSRVDTLLEAAPYYVLPTGYGQIKKTQQGLSMFDDDLPISGSYTDSGNLRFPVEDTLENRIQAGVFGQWASDNARDYFDNDWAPLKEKQIDEFVDLDIPIKDYREIRADLAKLDTLGEKAVYISDLDLPIDKKNLLINNIADREEPIDLTDMVEYGDFGEFDYAQKYPDKYSFLTENGVSYDEYQNFDEDAKEAWSWAYQNPEKFTLSKAVTSDLLTYKRYTKDLGKIKADKDEEGKSISGSRKEKVLEYINNMDADYGEKLILFKSEYNADDTYNMEIINYLNSRDDISYEDMETILKELGFTVSSDGYISW